MAALPIKLRTVLKSDMPDADWSATQVAPDEAIVADLAGSLKVGCFYVARAEDGSVVDPSGTCDLQPVGVSLTQSLKGQAGVTTVRAGATDADVVGGQALVYDDLGNTQGFTLRVADGSNLGGTVDHIDIYWNTIA